jgi:UDP-GlcNAc:undecaprenyl-phosphate GlcNAc-1-phosphate transferase
MQYVAGFMIALTVTIALMPLLMRAGLRLRVLDVPGGRRIHTTPIPRVGGVAMAVGIALALALFGIGGRPLQALLLGGATLVAFGVWDDRAELPASLKLLGQLIAALVAVIWGGISISTVTLTERQVLPGWLALPLTMVFLVGATNAVNLSDGLDGLAGGMALLCLCALAVIAASVHQPFVVGSSLVVVGAILGFLRFNTHPARVFMGDAGSQLLGFTIAYLSVLLTQDTDTPLSSALPLLLLGVPLVDTATVMIERIAAGRSPFSADRNHLHHRLLALGFDHAEAVAASYGVQALFFLAAWFMRFDSDLDVCSAFLVGAITLVGTIRLAQYRGWRRRPLGIVRKGLTWLRAHERLPRWSQALIALALAGYVLVVAISGRAPGNDTRWLGIAAFVLLLGGLIWRQGRGAISGVEKTALYVTAALAVYLDVPTRFAAPALYLEIVLLLVLITSIVVWVRLCYGQRFQLTPLDLLVVIVALAVPNLPGSVGNPQGLGAAVLKLVALFYGIETLSTVVTPQARRPWLSGAGIAFLGVMLLRAM